MFNELSHHAADQRLRHEESRSETCPTHSPVLKDSIVARAPEAGHDIVVLDTIRETGNVPIFEKIGFRAFSEETTNELVSEKHATLHEVRMERHTQEFARPDAGGADS